MKPEPARVAHPPQKPLMMWDGDCAFCQRWVERFRRQTGGRVEFVPFQDANVAARFPELRREALEQAVHLVEPDGRVIRGAAAVFRALAHTPGRRWPLWLYEHCPGVALVTEWSYRVVARHRGRVSRTACAS